MEVVAALLPLGYEEQLGRAAQALIDDQNADCSWGLSNGTLILETTHSLIALQLLASICRLAEKVAPAIERGRQWLWSHIDNIFAVEYVWLCKEVFSPVRVDDIYKLSVLLAPELQMTRTPVELPVAHSKVAAYAHEEGQ
jgi:hypothetical protein